MVFLCKQEVIHEEQFLLQCTRQVIRFLVLRASIHTAYTCILRFFFFPITFGTPENNAASYTLLLTF